MTLPDIMFWQKKCVETRLNPVEPEVFSSLGSRPGDSAPWTRTRQSTCPQAGQFIGQNDNCEVNSEVNPNKSCWFIHLTCFTKSCWTNQSAVDFYHIRSKISTYFLSAGGVLVTFQCPGSLPSFSSQSDFCCFALSGRIGMPHAQ